MKFIFNIFPILGLFIEGSGGCSTPTYKCPSLKKEPRRCRYDNDWVYGSGSCTYSCKCRDGYDGNCCQNIVKPCGKPGLPFSWKKCRNGGTCVASFNEYLERDQAECACPDGLFGEKCDRKCSTKLCPEEKGECVVDKNGAFVKCKCEKGYFGQNCECQGHSQVANCQGRN